MNRVHILKVAFILVCCLFLVGATNPGEPAAAWENKLFQFVLLLSGLIIFVVLSAFYEGSETATVSLDRLKIYQLAEQGDKRAQIVKKLVENSWDDVSRHQHRKCIGISNGTVICDCTADTPEKTLGMTLVGTSIANVLASQTGLLFVIALLQMSSITQTIVTNLRTNEQAVAIFISTALILVFGQLLPKTIFRVKANSLALRYAVPLRMSNVILRPIVDGITHLTSVLVKIGERRAAPTSADAQRDELRLLASMGEQSGWYFGRPTTYDSQCS